jgi:hypothetical protein
MRVPTDLGILERIYDRYYPTFAGYAKDAAGRKSKIYVPVDIEGIARELRVDGDIVFGRLYYHLEEKYGYTRPAGDRVHFFALEVGGDRHCVNFPLMASVLAGLQEENRKFQLATWIAIISLMVSVAAICFSTLA